MKNYNRDNRFNRGRGPRKTGGRDSGRPGMHQATCDDCGIDCEVPFKPTGNKPIYCSNCFEKSQGEDSRRSGRDRGGRRFPSRDSRDRGTDQVVIELNQINKKLDHILDAIIKGRSQEKFRNEVEEESVEPKIMKKTKKTAPIETELETEEKPAKKTKKTAASKKKTEEKKDKKKPEKKVKKEEAPKEAAKKKATAKKATKKTAKKIKKEAE